MLLKTPPKRRLFIKQSLTFALATASYFFGLKTGLGAWSAEQFADNQFNDSITHLFNNRTITDSDSININLPEVAENGAVVPITISSKLENINQVYILVEKNPTILAAKFELSPLVSAYISARIKMAESCNVIVIVQQNSELLKSQKWVKVMQGGCGTG